MNLRLRTTLAFIMAFVALTAVGVYATVSALDGVKSIDAVLEESYSQAAAQTRDDLDAILADSARLLSSVAGTIPDSEMYPTANEQALHQRLEPLIGSSFEWVILCEADGSIIISLPADADHDLPAVPTDRYYARESVALMQALPARAHPPFLIGGVKASEIVEPLFDNLPAGGEAVLLSPDGQVVASTLGPDVNPRERAPSGSVHASHAMSDGASVDVVGSRSTIAPIQARFVAAAAGSAFVLAGVSASIGMVMSRRITAPVDEIRAGMRSVKRGDLRTRVRVRGPKELSDLAEGFNRTVETLERNHNELMTLQTDLQGQVKERTDELQQRQEATEQFFYGISHDIKTPLLGISNAVDLLELELAQDEAKSTKQQRLLELARQSLGSMQTLVRDLLHFADAERRTIEPSDTNVTECIARDLALSESAAAAKGIDLIGPTQAIRADVDWSALSRAIQNLVGNAIDHMPDGRKDAKIRIELKARGRTLVIEVGDNGAGIPLEIRKRMFQPFTRSGDSRSTSTGLGLSITKLIVEAHGGNIEVESLRNVGSKFTITIPTCNARLAT